MIGLVSVGDSVRVALTDMWSDLFTFVPKLLGALLLILIGWILGKIVARVVTTALRAIRFNQIAEKADIDTFLQNSGVRMDPAAVVGNIAKWFVYLTFFLAAFNAFGLPQVSAVITDVLNFLPKVVVAIIILLAGALAGKLLSGVVQGALRSAGLQQADLFATVARFAVIAFAAIAALDTLEIAPNIVAGLWTGLIALVVGTLVLAFGLGGRQAAGDLTLGRLLRAELEPGVEIQTGPTRGTVRAIGSLFTTLETSQGIIKIPNSELTSQQLTMTPEAFQQQVQKRQELKDKAKAALEQGRSTGAASPPQTTMPDGSRRTVMTAAGTNRNN